MLRFTQPKEDNAAVANITAVLLSCLKALPLHEATHNIAVSLGPPWMNKAKDVFLTLLPSPSNTVRRAAAEGLALLATLGVTEDAHFLQSSVLHSLDQVMQGNLPDGKPRTSPFEPVSASRAGSLLTLACIQRMSQKVSETKMDRNKGRALSAEEVILKAEEALPTLQMMTRVLPSISRQGFRYVPFQVFFLLWEMSVFPTSLKSADKVVPHSSDFFIVETTGLHTFGLLLGYSSKLHKETLEAEDLQLLRKGAELVEDNFVASWTAASADFDAGQEVRVGAILSCCFFRVETPTPVDLLLPWTRNNQGGEVGCRSFLSCRFGPSDDSVSSFPPLHPFRESSCCQQVLVYGESCIGIEGIPSGGRVGTVVVMSYIECISNCMSHDKSRSGQRLHQCLSHEL